MHAVSGHIDLCWRSRSLLADMVAIHRDRVSSGVRVGAGVLDANASIGRCKLTMMVMRDRRGR